MFGTPGEPYRSNRETNSIRQEYPNHCHDRRSEHRLTYIDDYLDQQQPQSLLCLLILNQAQLISILYLSNLVSQRRNTVRLKNGDSSRSDKNKVLAVP